MAATTSEYVMTRLLNDIGNQLSEYCNTFNIVIDKCTWFHPRLWLDFPGRKYLQIICESCLNFPHETFIHSLILVINKFDEALKRKEMSELNLITLSVFCHLVLQFPNKGADANSCLLLIQLLTNKLLIIDKRAESFLRMPIGRIITSASLEGSNLIQQIVDTLRPFEMKQFFAIVGNALCTHETLFSLLSAIPKLLSKISSEKRSDFFLLLYNVLHRFSLHFSDSHTIALKRGDPEQLQNIFFQIYDNSGKLPTSWPVLAFIAPFILRKDKTCIALTKDSFNRYVDFYDSLLPTVGRIRLNLEHVCNALLEFSVASVKTNDCLLESKIKEGTKKLSACLANIIHKNNSKASQSLLSSYIAYELHSQDQSPIFTALFKDKNPKSIITALTALQLYTASYPTCVQIHNLPYTVANDTLDIIIESAKKIIETDLSNVKVLNENKDILNAGLKLMLATASPPNSNLSSNIGNVFDPGFSGLSNTQIKANLLEFTQLSINMDEIETPSSLQFFFEPLLEPGKLDKLINSLISLLYIRPDYCFPKIMLFLRNIFRPFNRLLKKVAIIEGVAFYSSIISIIEQYRSAISVFLANNSGQLEHFLECQQQFLIWLNHVMKERERLQPKSSNQNNQISKSSNQNLQIAQSVFDTTKLIQCYQASRFGSWIDKQNLALEKFCEITSTPIPTKTSPETIRIIFLTPDNLLHGDRTAQDCLKMIYSLLKEGESLPARTSGSMTKELINKLIYHLSKEGKPGREIIRSLKYIPSDSLYYLYDAIYAEAKKLFFNLAFESEVQILNLVLTAKSLPPSEDLEFRLDLSTLFVEMLFCNPTPSRFFSLVSSVCDFLVANLEGAIPSQKRLYIFWSLVDLLEFAVKTNPDETQPICSIITALGVSATGASIFDSTLEKASYYDTFNSIRETFGVILKLLNLFLEKNSNTKVTNLISSILTSLLRDNYEIAYDVYLSHLSFSSTSQAFKEVLATAISTITFSSGITIDNDKITTPAFTLSFQSLLLYNSPTFYTNVISFYWYFQKHWELLHFASSHLYSPNLNKFYQSFIELCYISSHYDLSPLLCPQKSISELNDKEDGNKSSNSPNNGQHSLQNSVSNDDLKLSEKEISDFIAKNIPIPGALGRFFSNFPNDDKKIEIFLNCFLEPYFTEPIFYANLNNSIIALTQPKAQFDIPAVLKELRTSPEFRAKIVQNTKNPLSFEGQLSIVKPYLGLIQFLAEPHMVVDELSSFIPVLPRSDIPLLLSQFSDSRPSTHTLTNHTLVSSISTPVITPASKYNHSSPKNSDNNETDPNNDSLDITSITSNTNDVSNSLSFNYASPTNTSTSNINLKETAGPATPPPSNNDIICFPSLIKRGPAPQFNKNSIFSSDYKPGTIPSDLERFKVFMKLRNYNAIGKFGKGLWLITLNSIPNIASIPVILLSQFFSLHFSTLTQPEDASILIDFAQAQLPPYEKIKEFISYIPQSVVSQIKAIFLLNISSIALDFVNKDLTAFWKPRVIILNSITEACNMFSSLPLRESSFAPMQSLLLQTEVVTGKTTLKIGFSKSGVYVNQQGNIHKQVVTVWQMFPYSTLSIVENSNGITLKSPSESIFLNVPSTKGQTIKNLIEFQRIIYAHRKKLCGLPLPLIGRTKAAFVSELLVKMSLENDSIYTTSFSAFQRVVNGYEGDETMAPGFGVGRTSLLSVVDSLSSDSDFLETLTLFIEKAVDSGSKTVEKASLFVEILMNILERRKNKVHIGLFANSVLTLHLRRADLTRALCRLVWNSVRGQMAVIAAEMVVDPAFEPRQALQILTAISQKNEDASVSAVLSHPVPAFLLSPLLQGSKKLTEDQLLTAFKIAYSFDESISSSNIFQGGNAHKAASKFNIPVNQVENKGEMKFGMWDVAITAYASFAGRSSHPEESELLEQMKNAAKQEHKIQQLLAMIPPTKEALKIHGLGSRFLDYLNSKIPNSPEYLLVKMEWTEDFSNWTDCISMCDGHESACFAIFKGAVNKELIPPKRAFAIALQTIHFPGAYDLMRITLRKSDSLLSTNDIYTLVSNLFFPSTIKKNINSNQTDQTNGKNDALEYEKIEMGDEEIQHNLLLLREIEKTQNLEKDGKNLLLFTQYLLGMKEEKEEDKVIKKTDLVEAVRSSEKYKKSANNIAENLFKYGPNIVREDRIIRFFLKEFTSKDINDDSNSKEDRKICLNPDEFLKLLITKISSVNDLREKSEMAELIYYLSQP